MKNDVPNIDTHSSGAEDTHRLSLPAHFKCETNPPVIFDPVMVDYMCHPKQTGGCISDRMINQMPWIEMNSEEKRAHISETIRESLPSVDVPLGPIHLQEDEILSWLQYPFDDILFNNDEYLEESSGLPFTSFSSQNLLQEMSKLAPSQQLIENSDSNMGIQYIITPADAAVGSSVPGPPSIVSQSGTGRFDIDRVSKQSCSMTSSSHASNIDDVPINVGLSHSSTEADAGKRSTMNFPFFSQHIASVKSILKNLGGSSGPSIKDRLLPTNYAKPTENWSSIEYSMSVSCSKESSPNRDELRQGNQTAAHKRLDLAGSNDKPGEEEVQPNASTSAIGTEILETGHVTLTSVSAGSGYSTGKSTKNVKNKRKPCTSEEFECDSKDTGRIASQDNELVVAPSSSGKRSRAAEIHNQSERRRRNKINEKMRALQELIPNANKTDKASMLDEAIEYVKMLQAQLQFMSMRTGMVIPPILMPPGMQYLSQQQRPSIPHPNMAMGISNRGFGSPGMTDTSTSSASTPIRPVFGGQLLPDQASHHIAGYPPHNSSGLVTNRTHIHHMSSMYNVPGIHQPQLSASQRAFNIARVSSEQEKIIQQHRR
ncbi:hypothetical protein KP509_10G063500 [Ceratopteris richardii]|uniref:BHLH domain-containing protein n=2 Tax=Ceratopteris richardii TaxID=49495 RepID=A0A8T2U242_CERRI|nr:hypothetical protein KP509_10G063500 [Ceratopteris richardii]